MLFRLFQINSNPLVGLAFILLYFISLSFVIAVHEWAHAWMANRLGDSTAKWAGRLTLNPLAHLDPLGTLALLFFGFGWGKPVPVNEHNLRSPKRDGSLVSLAGPLSNFVWAVLFSLLIRFLPFGGVVGGLLYSFLAILIQINLMLGIFNLLPLFPLDGFRIVLGFLPYEMSLQWAQMSRFGPWVLLFLIVTGMLGKILFTPLNLLTSLLL